MQAYTEHLFRGALGLSFDSNNARELVQTVWATFCDVVPRFDTAGRWSDPPVDPERFLLATETLGLIQRCLDGLPLNQRMAFYLREIEEHSSSEVCKILSVTTTHLGVLLYRARNRLRECTEGKVKAKAG